ncbi:MAG: hypothetical protein Q9198_010012 [Flavoplaca austrocitrina]
MPHVPGDDGLQAHSDLKPKESKEQRAYEAVELTCTQHSTCLLDSPPGMKRGVGFSTGYLDTRPRLRPPRPPMTNGGVLAGLEIMLSVRGVMNTKSGYKSYISF